MHELPRDIDAEAVIAIGRFLDERGRTTPVPVLASIAVLRERVSTSLSDDELTRLLVEMCATRNLTVLFDEPHD